MAHHLASIGLPTDSGRSLRWVWVRCLGVPIGFPNFAARRQILFWHDTHHLLTGYATTWTGEAEIGGFEIATSCKRYWAAWFFNFGGWLFGLGINPRRTFAAFVRGRHCTNFYGVDEARVRALSVDQARAELGLLRAGPPATFADAVAFAGWSLLIVALYVMLPLLAVWFGLAWLCG
jgi:hypothetical protein